MSNRDELTSLLNFPHVCWLIASGVFCLLVAHAAGRQAETSHPDVATGRAPARA